MNEKKQIRVKDIWLLYLMRNTAPALRAESLADRDGCGESARFFVFDYFDKLVCTRGDTLDYQTCLGLRQRQGEAAPPVAAYYLTLVSLEDGSSGDDDPFFYGQQDSAVSDKPFLSMIMVTILARESGGRDSDLHSDHEEDVNSFLLSSAGELRTEVERMDREWRATQAGPGSRAVFKVLYSVSSGNFCIAVRSASPELASRLTLRIREMTLNADRRFGFPSVSCNTFTITSVEHRTVWDGTAAPLRGMPAEGASAKVALRFTTSCMEGVSALPPVPFPGSDSQGPHGRRDITLFLDMAQFCQIYPWISACKFKTQAPQDMQAKVPDSIVEALKKILLHPSTQCVNEQLLVDGLHQLSPGDKDSEDVDWQQQNQAQILEENRAVMGKLQALLDSAQDVPRYREEYSRLLCLLQNLWGRYCSLRFQSDSYANGNMFLAQIWHLLNMIERYIGSIDRDSRHILYQDLLVHFKTAINGINRFQKLTQSVNQQSLQAPNYEVQMHTDLEKFVVAYTEFSRRFLAEHFNYMEDRQRILPILTTDTRNDAIEAYPLFLLPYSEDKDQDLFRTNPTMEKLMLSIVLPDIDTVGNLYATLPLICHELSHNFRVIVRKDRNNVLCGFILRKVAAYTVRQWISRTCARSAYVAFGYLEDQIILCLADCLRQSYQNRCGSAHETANVGVLTTNLLAFLMDFFFINQNDYIRQTPGLPPKKIGELLERLGGMVQENIRIEGAEWYHSYRRCQKTLSGGCAPAELSAIAHELKVLTDSMRLEILSVQVQQVLSTAEQVVRFAREHFTSADGQEKSQENEGKINRFVADIGQVYQDSSLLDILSFSAADTDQWIFGVQEILMPSCQAVLDLYALTGEGEAWRGKLKVRVKTFEAALQSSCQAIKDASLLAEFILSYQYASGKGAVGNSQTERRALLDQIRSSLRSVLENIQEDRGAKWIYGAEQVQELIAPLGIDLESGDLFYQTLEQVLHGITDDVAEMLVTDSTTSYREIFADLGMCASLGLDVPGYLLVLANTNAFYNSCLDAKNAPMKLERMRMVCYALSCGGEAEAGFPQLRENCKTLYVQVAAGFEAFMTPEGLANPVYQGILERLSSVIDRPNEAEYPQFMSDIPDFPSLLKEEYRGKAAELYQALKRLWNMIWFSSHVRQTQPIALNDDLVRHFCQLYHSVLRPEWVAAEEKHPNSHILNEIGRFYNRAQAADLFQGGSGMLKETLSFVLYYYYHNWNIFSRGPGSDQLDSWIERLIGGKGEDT